MGASTLKTTSFEMSASTHSISVDSDLSLLTVTIGGLSSATFVSLVRPDGKHYLLKIQEPILNQVISIV